jgi:hypothetical protein
LAPLIAGDLIFNRAGGGGPAQIAAVIVKANPYRRHHARTVAGEPRIFRAVGGPGFTADIMALQIASGAPAGPIQPGSPKMLLFRRS